MAEEGGYRPYIPWGVLWLAVLSLCLVPMDKGNGQNGREDSFGLLPSLGRMHPSAGSDKQQINTTLLKLGMKKG